MNNLYNDQNQLIKEIFSIVLSKHIDSRPINFNSRHKKEADEIIISFLSNNSNYLYCGFNWRIKGCGGGLSLSCPKHYSQGQYS